LGSSGQEEKNKYLNMNFIFDAHLDLGMNAMEWNRDLRQPVQQIRESEEGMDDKPDRGKGTVAFPELRKGNIGLVVATQIARYVKKGNNLPGWNSPAQAWAQTQAQLAWYKSMEEENEMIQITDADGLHQHLKFWFGSDNTGKKPIGYILSLEGADSIVDLNYLEKSYSMGLRALGPAHYGPGTYAQGTDASGGLGSKGKDLLREMETLNIILDVTHLCSDSFWEALNNFNGPVWASHCNARALVDHNRQLSDDQIKALVERNAVIGGALDAWMLKPGWIRGKSTPEKMKITLDLMIDHMDHICQIAGNVQHIGIGSDLDGAFGKEQCPYDMDTIADLQRLPELLMARGYSQSDVEHIMYKNFIRFLHETWGDV
jgi:membrane dipeptidase